MSTPELALTVSYWFHMLATTTWIGSLLFTGLVLLPLLERVLPSGDFYQLVHSIARRMDPIGWFSLAVLTVTGLIQMSANPNYSGFLSLVNRWSAAIFFKHLVFLLILALSAVQTWRLIPALERALWLRAQDARGDAPEPHHRRIRRLLQFNLLLSLVVLIFTAIARVA
jgi:uncharacterized membrane protein